VIASGVRTMELKDIPQVSEIEREAFPPPWPATNFKRDLTVNTLTHYLVAYETSHSGKDGPVFPASGDLHHAPSVTAPHRMRSLLGRLLARDTSPRPLEQRILGFAGVWFMVDEAHLSNIAVREGYQQRGIGELLVISVIKLAIDQSACCVTLEVRAGNEAARRLYRKCGFNEVGVRRSYYTDNKEDAVLMTADAITSAPFPDNFRRLREAYSRRWGIPV
jgi:ribosomal-protein-alanine N-acetyltransferase